MPVAHWASNFAVAIIKNTCVHYDFTNASINHSLRKLYCYRFVPGFLWNVTSLCVIFERITNPNTLSRCKCALYQHNVQCSLHKWYWLDRQSTAWFMDVRVTWARQQISYQNNYNIVSTSLRMLARGVRDFCCLLFDTAIDQECF